MNIIHKILVLVTIFITTSLLTGCGDNKKDQYLTVGVSADYPPFEFMKDNIVHGFDIDLMKLIAAEMDMEVTFKDMDFNALIPSLQSSRIDAAVSGITINDERKNNIDFTDTYYIVKLAALTKSSIPLKEEDLKGKKIGVQTGSTLEEYAKQVPNTIIISQSNTNQLMQELKLNRVDVVLCETAQAKDFAENYHLNYSLLNSLKSGYAIGLKKNSPLKEKFDKSIETLKANGSIEKLIAKWIK